MTLREAAAMAAGALSPAELTERFLTAIEATEPRPLVPRMSH
ncbi:hypothetical protein [Nonomuraea sp. NPDC002799]